MVEILPDYGSVIPRYVAEIAIKASFYWGILLGSLSTITIIFIIYILVNL